MFRLSLLNALTAGSQQDAVVDDWGQCTYQDLDHWSGHLAAAIGPQNDAAEAHSVAMLAPNGASWIAAYLAALKTGATVTPLNMLLTTDEISRALGLTRPRHLFTVAERAEEMTELCSSLRLYTEIHTLELALPPAYALAPEAAPATTAAADATGPDQPCLVMLTSGSTGAAKGVVQTEQSLHLATELWRGLHREPSDVVAVTSPLAHTYGHLAAISTLLGGARLVLTSSNDPVRWVQLMHDHKVTVIEGVPALYDSLLGVLTSQSTSLPHLRRCLTAGQAVSEKHGESWARHTGHDLIQSWGMTELSGPGLCAPADGSMPGTAGTPMPGIEIRLTDPTTEGEEAAADTPGEIWVRGAQVTPGYQVSSWGTQRATDTEGWLHTGDLALQDERGALRIVGRSKDTIVSAGYNINPTEVENALRTHPLVKEAAVIGREDPNRGEVPHALVIPSCGEQPAAEDLVEHCSGILARYKVPRTVHIVTSLPTTPTGKLDRRALRQQHTQAAPVSEGDEANVPAR